MYVSALPRLKYCMGQFPINGCRIRKDHLNYIDSRDFWEFFVKSRHIKTCIYKQVLELAMKLMVFIIIFSDQPVYATMAMIMRFLYFQISSCVCYNDNDNEVFILSDQPVYVTMAMIMRFLYFQISLCMLQWQ